MLRKLFAVLCLMIAYAPFAQAEDYSPSSYQLSLVDQICIQVMGFKRGETYFSACRESLSHALPVGSQTRPLAIDYADADGTEAGKSFYEVSPTVRWNRERYACARLGLRPGSTSFHQCAAGLDDAFLPSPN